MATTKRVAAAIAAVAVILGVGIVIGVLITGEPELGGNCFVTRIGGVCNYLGMVRLIAISDN